jgi:hypothetical protein
MGSGGLRSVRFPIDEGRSERILGRFQPAATVFLLPHLSQSLYRRDGQPDPALASRLAKPAKQGGSRHIFEPISASHS